MFFRIQFSPSIIVLTSLSLQKTTLNSSRNIIKLKFVNMIYHYNKFCTYLIIFIFFGHHWFSDHFAANTIPKKKENTILHVYFLINIAKRTISYSLQMKMLIHPLLPSTYHLSQLIHFSWSSPSPTILWKLLYHHIHLFFLLVSYTINYFIRSRMQFLLLEFEFELIASVQGCYFCCWNLSLNWLEVWIDFFGLNVS